MESNCRPCADCRRRVSPQPLPPSLQCPRNAGAIFFSYGDRNLKVGEKRTFEPTSLSLWWPRFCVTHKIACAIIMLLRRIVCSHPYDSCQPLTSPGAHAHTNQTCRFHCIANRCLPMRHCRTGALRFSVASRPVAAPQRPVHRAIALVE